MKSDLDLFIKQIVKELKAGVEGSEWTLHDEIEFELLVQVSQKTNGGFNLKVVGASGEKQNNTTQRVKFKIINERQKSKNSLDQINGAGILIKSMIEPLKRAEELNNKRIPKK